jgi:hypothetical protein
VLPAVVMELTSAAPDNRVHPWRACTNAPYRLEVKRPQQRDVPWQPTWQPTARITASSGERPTDMIMALTCVHGRQRPTTKAGRRL